MGWFEQESTLDHLEGGAKKTHTSSVAAPQTKLSHYYGHYLRRLFIIGAMGSVLSLPFYPDLLPLFPVSFVILVSLGVVIVAGITNPHGKTVAIGDTIVSAVLFTLFQYYTVVGYESDPRALSLIREGIALIYLTSVYYSVKTVRGMMLEL